MANLTVRNLNDRVVDALKTHAKANDRSVEAELRKLITDHVERLDRMARFRDAARQIAAMTPEVGQTDSTDLLRQDRQR